MTMKIGKFILALAMVLALHTIGFAAITAETRSVDIAVKVPEVDGLTVQPFVIDSHRTDVISEHTWTTSSSLDFGELYVDEQRSVFRAQLYGAVDVAVRDNSGTPWQVAIDTTSIAKVGGTANLDKYLLLTYKKVIKVEDLSSPTGAKDSETDLGAGPFNKATLVGGWLRVYCALKNEGLTGKDNGLPLETEMGAYSGSLTVTLTPL